MFHVTEKIEGKYIRRQTQHAPLTDGAIREELKRLYAKARKNERIFRVQLVRKVECPYPSELGVEARMNWRKRNVLAKKEVWIISRHGAVRL